MNEFPDTLISCFYQPLTAMRPRAIINQMVNSRAGSLDETFFALSDPTRREMVARLARRESTVGELAAPFRMSAPAVSKHLRVLERAGLVEQDRLGRVRRCRLVPEPLHEAATWVEKHRRFWEAQLDQLGHYLQQVQSTPTKPHATKAVPKRSKSSRKKKEK